MNTDLSMQARTNQVCSAVREKEENRTAERRRHILYLIWQYLGENGYNDAQNTLAGEAQLSPYMEVCDNINLEMILMEYESYYRIKFNKYPMLCKKVTKDNVNETENKSKQKSTSKLKKADSVKRKTVEQPTNGESTNDVNLAMTVTPIFPNEDEGGGSPEKSFELHKNRQSEISKCIQKLYSPESELRKIAEDVSKEIVLSNLNVHWKDVIGLEDCKTAVREAIVYPLKYPVFFSDKFSHWKGILLYGAPGTGKTMLAKAVATECNCTFFNITASSLVSKWRGDSEKYIRVLFDLAYSQSPTIIFIDEIDWITTRIENDTLSEPAKRFRSELLARLDGLISNENSNVVLLAATNAPWNIDAALLRRLEKRIHVPLPDDNTRLNIFQLYVNPSILQDLCKVEYILQQSKHFSGADIKLICKGAWMAQVTPIWIRLERQEISIKDLNFEITDFNILSDALRNSSPTVKTDQYTKWK